MQSGRNILHTAAPGIAIDKGPGIRAVLSILWSSETTVHPLATSMAYHMKFPLSAAAQRAISGDTTGLGGISPNPFRESRLCPIQR